MTTHIDTMTMMRVTDVLRAYIVEHIGNDTQKAKTGIEIMERVCELIPGWRKGVEQDGHI